MDDTARLESIKHKVAQASDLNLNPCLTEAEIAAFEREHNIRLPEGYRLFLKEIGNGGDGPTSCTGLAPLPIGQTKTLNGEDLGPLDQPFPLAEYWVFDEEEEADEALDENGRAALEAERDARYEACINNGQLYLGSDGCDMYWYVIATGPERGQVWEIGGEAAQPCAPRRGFLEWYELWLDWRETDQKKDWVLQVVFADFNDTAGQEKGDTHLA